MKEKKTILIVENNPLLEKTFRHLLALWGYHPLSVRTGKEAMDTVRLQTFDLILLDQNLPDMDGFQLLTHFKRELVTAYLPLILLIEKKSLRRDMIQRNIIPDDYLVKPIDPFELRLRVEMILHRTEHQLSANPLTRLPGSLALEREIERRLSSDLPLSVCYCDIDRFKSLNDAYGYHRGNAVLHQTAHLIVQALHSHGEKSDWAGHIGGDDFMMLTTPEREEGICRNAIQEFDRLMPLHYSESDRKRGFVVLKNRMGKTERFPFITLSIAVVNNKKRKLESALHISEIASDVKKFLKERPHSQSAYLVDRRTGEEKGKVARQTQSPVTLYNTSNSNKQHKPLGQLLLESRAIPPQKLEEALLKHWHSGCRLGQVLLELNLVDSETLGRVLSEQLGVPYVKVDQVSPPVEGTESLSEGWLKEHGVLPVKKEGTWLSLAMVNPLDQKIIQWVEEKTGCHVRPCLTMEKDLEAHLGKLDEAQDG